MARVIPNLALLSALTASLAFGTILVQYQTRLSPKAAAPEKILVCHIPPGNPEAAQTLEISSATWLTGHSPHNAHSLDFIITDIEQSCPPVIEE